MKEEKDFALDGLEFVVSQPVMAECMLCVKSVNIQLNHSLINFLAIFSVSVS